MAKINVQKLIDRAQKNYRNQKWNKALDDYITVSKAPLGVKNPKIHHKIADIYNKLKETDNAVKAYTQAVRCYMTKGFLLQAISVCKQAKKLAPDNEDIESQLTELYARRGLGSKKPSLTPAPKAAPEPSPAPKEEPEDDDTETTGEVAQDMFESTMPSLDLNASKDQSPAEEPSLPEEDQAPDIVEAPEDKDEVAEKPLDDGSYTLTIGDDAEESVEDLMKEAVDAVESHADKDEEKVDIPIETDVREPQSNDEIDLTDDSMPDEIPIEDEVKAEAPAEDDMGVEIDISAPDEIPIEIEDSADESQEEDAGIDIGISSDEKASDDAPEISVETADDDAPDIDDADVIDLLDDIPLFPDIPLFSDLSTEEFDRVVKSLTSTKVQKGSKIIEEGDEGSSLFIVSIGEVQVMKKLDDKVVPIAQLRDGDFFGEFGFFSGAMRQASVIATTETDLMEINKDDMDKIVGEFPSIKEKLNKLYTQRVLENLLLTSPLFRPLKPEERKNLASVFEYQAFEENAGIIKEGDEGDCMYVMQSGEVSVHTTDPMGDKVGLATLKAGDFFGEMSLIQSKPRTANVTALTPVEVMMLNKDDFDNLIDKYPAIGEVIEKTAEERSTEVVNKVSFLDLDEDDFEAGSLL